MAEITLTETIDKQEWDESAAKYGTSINQLYFNAERHTNTLFITARENGELIGGTMIFKPEGMLNKTIAIAPFAKDEQTLNEIITELKKQMNTFINYIILEYQDRTAKYFEQQKFVPEKKATVIVKLDKDLQEIKKNLDKKARWGINKAIKFGLKATEAKLDEDWQTFYEIYKQTCKKDGIAPMPEKEYETIRTKTNENIRTLLLIKNGQDIIAGSLIYKFKNYAVHSLNGSKQEALALQPNNLLYWAMIEYSKKKGLDYLNLGGYSLDARTGSKTDGINKFKIRWGQLVYFNIYGTSKTYFTIIRMLKKIGVLK